MPLLIRLALRDLRGGISGFGIFLACIALGVAAISGVVSVSRSLSDGLAAQGRVILGGDASFDLIQREASPAETAFFRSHGRLAEVSVLRAMARREGGDAALVELKAVGADYPDTGRVVLDPDGREARRFGVKGSGHVLLYEPSGDLVFSGGITPSRGHEGDNPGRSAVIDLINGGRAAVHRTPVFGCPLLDDPSSTL